MNLLTLRSDIGMALDAYLPPGVVYYDHPAEVVALPAVVFVPNDRYWAPSRIDGVGKGVRVEFELQLLVPRTVDVPSALDGLESLAVAVSNGAADLGLLWGELSGLEPLKVNDLDALFCRMAFSVNAGTT